MLSKISLQTSISLEKIFELSFFSDRHDQLLHVETLSKQKIPTVLTDVATNLLGMFRCAIENVEKTSISISTSIFVKVVGAGKASNYADHRL